MVERDRVTRVGMVRIAERVYVHLARRPVRPPREQLVPQVPDRRLEEDQGIRTPIEPRRPAATHPVVNQGAVAVGMYAILHVEQRAQVGAVVARRALPV